MTRQSLAKLIVRWAALLVPARAREDWVSEWNAELWHIVHKGAAKDSLTFSLGAVQDAAWMRLETLRAFANAKLHAGSAVRCALLLGALVAAGILLCVALPGARATLQPLPYHDAHELVVLSSNGQPGTQAPSIRLADYREWTTDTAGLYKQIAFYQPTMQRVHFTHHPTATLSVAVASANLLEMLGVPGASGEMSHGPRLILSRAAWKKFYHGRADVFGRMADVAGEPATIAGVIPNTAWRLPGQVDAWLLEDAHGLAMMPPTATGFVVARIRDSAFPPPRAGWRSMVETRNDVLSRYVISSIDTIVLQPLFAFGCSLLLALMALPAITALSLGDYPLSREPLRRRLVARRWLFLGSKFLLMIAAVYFWSTVLAFGPGLDLPDGSGIKALTSFLPLLFGMRWVLQDQRRRCPVCLRTLSNPARVGQASCNFLGWAGTELMCASGHGLLHIPELPTSWFGTQRWLCLDPSWLCLFAEQPSTSADVV
ncbi:MAG: hypothetical protein WA414_18905 [Acidobacteriaceae bacterium]